MYGVGRSFHISGIGEEMNVKRTLEYLEKIEHHLGECDNCSDDCENCYNAIWDVMEILEGIDEDEKRS